MKRGIPLVVAAVLIAASFVAGYALRSPDLVPALRGGGGQALAQSPSPAPSPHVSPRSSPGGQRDRAERGLVVGTVESVQGRTLVVKVTSARGVAAAQGATLSTEVGTDAQILREIALADLRKGNTVVMRGAMEGGKFVVRQVQVELR